MTTQETIALFDKHVIPNYGRNEIVLVRGEGLYVWDADGNRYLDLFPGWAVNGLGHCHPRVTKAIQEQAAKLQHVPNTFYMEPQGRAAQFISELSFGGQCFFCNSGAEANEAAIKLARIHSPEGRFKIITMENSFHGRTLAAISATAQPKYHKGFEPIVEGFTYVPFNDLAAVEAAVDPETCAVMLEPVQGEGGVNVATPDYMSGLRKLCDDRGLLLVLDEVQTGMGRTGRYFGYQHYDAVPDIMTLAKSLGGGVAIGAICAKKEIGASLKPGTHASTFGGNPIATAACVAVFEAIEEEGLLENARKIGDLLRSELERIASDFSDKVREVRGLALMMGMELTVPGSDIAKECMSRGLLINCTHETVLRIMPPLIVEEPHIEEGIEILRGVMRDLS